MSKSFVCLLYFITWSRILSLSPSFFVGFDLGTSGARISVIDERQDEVHSGSFSWTTYDDPDIWIQAVSDLLIDLRRHLDEDMKNIKSICVSGTSASCLIVDVDTQSVIRKPRMYDFDVSTLATAKDVMLLLSGWAPDLHTTQSPTSSLAKLLSWHMEEPLLNNHRICHQSDYVASKLIGRSMAADWHNVLKLGYDVQARAWPSWLESCLRELGIDGVLPKSVVSPGETVHKVSKESADAFGLSEDCMVVGGTTDSNAAFVAAAGKSLEIGTAVTSLGSTLALKQLSRNYVEDSSMGIYSHRFPSVLIEEQHDLWLVGGASNVGCSVLRQQRFDNKELEELSKLIDPNVESSLSYYPLTKTGERFPIADSELEPCLEPLPPTRQEFLHGIFQGISSVEVEGYLALGKLCGSYPNIVYSTGGGSRNPVWTQMRDRRLNAALTTRVEKAPNVEASLGATVLARAGYLSRKYGTTT